MTEMLWLLAQHMLHCSTCSVSKKPLWCPNFKILRDEILGKPE